MEELHKNQLLKSIIIHVEIVVLGFLGSLETSTLNENSHLEG